MSLTFYFDENMSEHSAHSLHRIRSILFKEVVTTIVDEFQTRGTSDEDIAAHLSAKTHKCIIVTQDDDFTKRDLYAQIMGSKNMGLFLIKFNKGSKSWDQHKYLVKRWDSIRSKCKRFPFAYVVRGATKFDKI